MTLRPCDPLRLRGVLRPKKTHHHAERQRATNPKCPFWSSPNRIPAPSWSRSRDIIGMGADEGRENQRNTDVALPDFAWRLQFRFRSPAVPSR